MTNQLEACFRADEKSCMLNENCEVLYWVYKLAQRDCYVTFGPGCGENFISIDVQGVAEVETRNVDAAPSTVADVLKEEYESMNPVD